MSEVEIDVEIHGETELALFVYDGNISCWLPKSQISNVEENGENATIYVPEWLAMEKGLV